jgi:hypothetical protein
MKPNGTYVRVRKLLFVVCAVGLLAGLGKAETLHGRFQLPIEVHWGRIVLPADEYELTIDSRSPCGYGSLASRELDRHDPLGVYLGPRRRTRLRVDLGDL